MSLAFYEPSISNERIYVPAFAEGSARSFDATDDIVWREALDCWNQQGVEFVFIHDLEDGYEVLQPLLAKIERIGEENYLASFDEANIAVGGDSSQDAYQALVADILDTFDSLSEEPRLSPMAEAQIGILRNFIVKPQPIIIWLPNPCY